MVHVDLLNSLSKKESLELSFERWVNGGGGGFRNLAGSKFQTDGVIKLKEG